MPDFWALTPRQRRVIGRLAEGKTLEQIGDEMKLSRQRVWQILGTAKGRASELMDEFGLSEAALITKYLLPALGAEETKFFQKDGEVKECHDVIAWGPRLQALELAARIKGMFAPPKTAIGVSAGDVHIEVVSVGGQ
jgi:DNA-binding CsgD family transcriptional regulator